MLCLFFGVFFFVRATRPGKAETTYQPLIALRESPELLESETSNTTATNLEVVYEVDLAGKFSAQSPRKVVGFKSPRGQVLRFAFRIIWLTRK
jgi:hypothetical protein